MRPATIERTSLRADPALPSLLVSLPWYDLPEVRPATDLLWSVIAHHIRRAGVGDPPELLLRDIDCFDQWRSPRCLFSQACGYDARISYRRELRIVATPCYAAPGCAGPNYRSFVVVPSSSKATTLADLRGQRCVYNNTTSHSGRNALRFMVAPLSRNGGFFGAIEATGSHVASLARIQSGHADVAAIDCVTFELLRRHRPSSLAGLRVLAVTPAAPAPPFVTGAWLGRSARERLGKALAAAVSDAAAVLARDALLLTSVEHLPFASYDAIASMERAAAGHGYHELAPCPRYGSPGSGC